MREVATPADDVPPLSPVQRRGQIETDAFCGNCQYNLHGQPVTVDERLQLPVCRCPECGRFHPAGVATSSNSVWVRRLGTLLLYLWVATITATVLTICFFLGVLAVASIEYYVQGATVSDDGRPVVRAPVTSGKAGNTSGYVIAGTNEPAGRLLHVELLHPILGGPAGGEQFAESMNDYYGGGFNSGVGDRYRNGPGPTPFAWLSAGSLALGCLAGSLCVVFLWHWPRRRYAWALIVVALPIAFVWAVFNAQDETILIRRQVAGRLAVAAVVQSVGVGIGLRVGRPIARGVARAFIPPKPRQLLAFLWQVDGQVPPTTADGTGPVAV